MTDKLSIDLSNIDKNSLLFKKFMNKKQNNSNSNISMSVVDSTPATKDYHNNSSIDYQNRNSQSLQTDKSLLIQKSYPTAYRRDQIKQQRKAYNESNVTANFNNQDIDRQKVRSSYEKYQTNFDHLSNFGKIRQQYSIKQSFSNPGSINLISPRSRRNRNQKSQYEPYSNEKKEKDVQIKEKDAQIDEISPVISSYNHTFNYQPKQTEYSRKEPIIQYQRGILTKKWDQTEKAKQPQWQTYEPEDYKKKYQLLHKQYEQLQKSTLQQNKARKREVLQAVEKVEQMSQRMFQIQTYNDQLIMQNRKLKQKNEHQSKLRIKVQEDLKENQYKIQQLSDMLEGKQQNLKRKVDQIVHWTNQIQSLKQQIQKMGLVNEQLEQYCRQMQSESHGIQKQKNNKEFLVEDLRAKISSLIQQNSHLKDQIYNITTKLYHFQSQNQTLKSDIVRIRDKQRFPISYLNQQMQKSSIKPSQNQSASSLTPQRNLTSSYDMQKRQQLYNQVNQQNPKPRQRRRGQFAKERQLKPQKEQIPQNGQNSNQNQFVSRRQNNDRNLSKQQSLHPEINLNKGSKVVRLRQLNEQLDKIKDMKAMNGKLRKRKIDLEREIMQLQGVSFN